MSEQSEEKRTSQIGQRGFEVGKAVIGPGMTEAEPLDPVYREWSDFFERSLRLQAYPVALKLCENDEAIPKLAKRPVRDWGYHLNTCQAMALSRRTGEVVAQKLEDMWCFESALALGMTGGDVEKYEKALKFFLEGRTHYPEAARDLETARKWAHDFPRFEDYGRYVAVVTAPLMRAPFEPDLILFWLNPTALNQVLKGIVIEWGRDGVQCTMAADGGCVHYIVPPMKNNDFNVSNPCFGDISFAMKEPGELVFSCPIDKVERLITGMRQAHSYGWSLPLRYDINPEGWLPDSYTTIRRIYGMGEPLIKR
jgi:uncharacterized protein (DUF169 family)